MSKSVPPPPRRHEREAAREGERDRAKSSPDDSGRVPRVPASTPRLPDSCAGSSGQWRPLEQLTGPARPPTPPSIRPTTLSMPPPPLSLDAIALATSPHLTAPGQLAPLARRPIPTVLRLVGGASLVALGLLLGVMLQRGESKPDATSSRAAPARLMAAAPPPSAAAPPLAPTDEVVTAPPDDLEISFEEAKAALRETPKRRAATTGELPTLPDFLTETKAAKDLTKDLTKDLKGVEAKTDPKAKRPLTQDANELARAQLEALP